MPIGHRLIIHLKHEIKAILVNVLIDFFRKYFKYVKERLKENTFPMRVLM